MKENLESAKQQTCYQFSKPTSGRSCNYVSSCVHQVIVGLVKLTDCGLEISQ